MSLKINWFVVVGGIVGATLFSTDSAMANDNPRQVDILQPFTRPQVRVLPGPCPSAECDAAGLKPHALGRRVVYLVFDGITLTKVTAQNEDATQNKSWIVSSTMSIPSFQTNQLSSTGGLSRSQIIQRVINQLYNSHDPFDVEFTTTRPTSGNYNMIVFGGSCSSVTGQGGCAGIAMGDCGDFLPNNITFVFPWGLRVDDLAATAAQEWAHGLGLGHTDDNYDVMFPSIQGGIIPTSFGEGQVPDNSGCGLSYQDSYQRMMSTIGPRGQDVSPPTITITSPQNGATVEAGTPVTVNASDASGIDFVEFRMGTQVVMDSSPPYASTIPDLGAGNHTIIVWAHDTKGNSNFAQISVYIADGTETSCTTNAECDTGEECKNNLCVPDNGLTGELGDMCMGNAECLSGICGTVGGESRCTQTCDATTTCPAGFDCAGGACWPANPDNGDNSDGGIFTCNTGNSGTSPLPTLLLLLGAILLARGRCSQVNKSR